MANTSLNTRLCLKRDTFNHWEAVKETFVPLAGEPCVIVVPASSGEVVQEPAVLLKIGDGATALKDLPYVSAYAADVYDWAKAATKPSYSANEIQGLSDYIAGEIEDTNTQFKLEQDETDGHKLTFSKKEKGAEEWTTVVTITIPVYDDTALTNLANSKVASVTAADDSVTVGGTATAPTVGVKISPIANNPLVLDTADGQKGLKVVLPAADTYSLVADEEPGEYAAVYHFTKNGENIGVPINVIKDKYFKGGHVGVSAADDAPYEGAKAGDYYIEIELQNQADKLYIPANGLVEYVTSGSAAGDMVVITIDPNTHKVTAAITDGTVTKAKLEASVQTSLNKADSAIQSVKVNGAALTPDGDKAVDISVPTGALASKDNVAKSDLADALKSELEGKANDADLASIAKSGDAKDLTQTEGDYLILNCGSATTVI